MARIRYTALVESINGSISGTTFQRNAYGNTIKVKPNIVTPSTLAQVERQNNFGNQARKWRTLSETDRTNWETYAAAYPRPSRLNPSSNLNGYNYFLMYHSFRSVFAPSALLANPNGLQGSLTFFANDIGIVSGQLNYGYNSNITQGPWFVMLYLTRIIPFGQEAVRETPKFIAFVNGNAGGGLDITNRYVSLFGFIPPQGQWLGIKVVYINSTNGQVIEQPWTQVEVQ